MSEVKTRVEALNASIEKWVDILRRIEGLQNDIDRMCGFCYLAKSRQIEKPRIFRCNLCEPDAKKLCKEYIAEERLIMNPLFEAWEKTDNLLTHLRSLPVDLK